MFNKFINAREICLIESPFQAFVFRNLIIQQKVLFNNCYVFVNKKKNININNALLIERELEGLNLKIRCVDKTDVVGLTILLFSLLNSNKIIIGDLLSSWMRVCIAVKRKWKDVFVLEDGTSLSVDFNDIQARAKLIKSSITFVSIISKVRKSSDFNWIKISSFTVSEGLNTSDQLASYLMQGSVIFLGAPYVEFYGVCSRCYSDTVDKLLNLYATSNVPVVYLPHRRETYRTKLAHVNLLEGISVDFEYIRILQNDIKTSKPITLVSFPSTAIAIMASFGLPAGSEVIIMNPISLPEFAQERHGRLVRFTQEVLDENNCTSKLFTSEYTCTHET